VHYLHHHEILENLMDVKPGDHLRVIYDYSPLEQIEHVAAYLQEGTAAGEQCVYMADDITDEQLVSALRRAGIDVDSARENSSILILTRDSWREPGALDTVRKAAQVRELADLALRAGFAGARFAVEITWALRLDLDPADLDALRSQSPTVLRPGAQVQALWLYDRKRIAAQTMVAGPRTRPMVMNRSGSRADGGSMGPSARQR
jgi:hypothetical protein